VWLFLFSLQPQRVIVSHRATQPIKFYYTFSPTGGDNYSMGLKAALSQRVLPNRRYLLRSLVLSALFFVAITIISTQIVEGNNKTEQIAVSQNTLSLATQYLQNISKTMMQINKNQYADCYSGFDEISRQAALTIGIRVFFLAKNNQLYCNSASGAMQKPVEQLFPTLDTEKNIDLQIQIGTLLVPEHPVIVLWMKSPLSATQGSIATIEFNPALLLATLHDTDMDLVIITRDQALSARTGHMTDKATLPRANYIPLTLPGYPLEIRLYNSSISNGQLRTVLVIALLFSLLLCLLLYYSQLNRFSPGRELLRSMQFGDFFVEYQPIIDAKTYQISGVEGLLRWNHPTEGRIAPDLFINYAESNGLILELTRHMLYLVAKDAAFLARFMPEKSRLSLNLAATHINMVSFRDDVLTFIEALPIDHFQVVFELTERSMLDEKIAIMEFQWLHQKNIKIAIDDFGTGHSALIYLEQFPVDYLKVDRGFVQSINEKKHSAPVLDAVLTLAQQLNIKTIAEGVETIQQAHYLQQHGGHYLQGYLFSKPLSPQALRQFVIHFTHKHPPAPHA
jgi:sensor c-di-GMP phosphodiesterase-like protein